MLLCLFVFVENINLYSMNMSLSTGEVIKHGDIKRVQNEGMPIYRAPYEKGQLIIHFQVRP